MSENKKCILIVDDDPFCLHVVSLSVQHFGYDCIGALSGEEGIKMLNSSLFAVITDMHMKVVNGNDVAHATKLLNHNIRTILMYFPNYIEPKKENFDNIIIKPFNVNMLRDALL